MDSPNPSRPIPNIAGRGARKGPPNRFESTHVEDDFEHLSSADESLGEQRKVSTEFLEDITNTILSENKSPDIPFRWSINPYRGCEHGCTYCYARPTHEYLGFDAALDFESKIMVKHRAAELLSKELSRSTWTAEPIAISGVTDCYQPAERRFQLTRQCLQVMRDVHQPMMIVTKNALVCRDIDLLAPMAKSNLANVSVSLTTLERSLGRTMEPRTSTPEARLRTIHELTAAGIPVQVMVAPVIPGLNDREIPAILEAAHEAGAVAASYVLLRLPLTVEPVFLQWIEDHRPLAADRVAAHIRRTRDGQLNSSQFGKRMRGEGPYAEQIANLFRVFKRKTGLDQRLPPLDSSLFRPPANTSGQLRLF